MQQEAPKMKKLVTVAALAALILTMNHHEAEARMRPWPIFGAVAGAVVVGSLIHSAVNPYPVYGYAPGYYAPPPTVVYAQPYYQPQVVYAAPPVIYQQPQPTYAAPQPVYTAPAQVPPQ